MQFIRKVLIKILGTEAYIKLVSKVYLLLVSNGLLKKHYPELFYMKSILKQGDSCIDIGANLGYYSTLMSRLVGNSGRVYSVEPVPLFQNIWKKNVKMSGIDNLTLFPYALGKDERSVKMGMPEKDGIIHHGMTKIAEIADEKYVQFFDVEMRNPDKLFGELDAVKFVKCDVEGYESEVFSNMKTFIAKYKPVVQSELSGLANRRQVIYIFEELGYKAHLLKNNQLEAISEKDILEAQQDFYFIPQ